MRPRHLLSIVSLLLVACGGGISTEEEDPVESEADRPRAISESGHGAFEAALAPMKDGTAVVWQDSRHGDAEIYYRLVGSSGQALGPEHRLTKDDVPSYAAQVLPIGVANETRPLRADVRVELSRGYVWQLTELHRGRIGRLLRIPLQARLRPCSSYPLCCPLSLLDRHAQLPSSVENSNTNPGLPWALDFQSHGPSTVARMFALAVGTSDAA